MTHVRIESLAARDHQDNGRQNSEAGETFPSEELHRVAGIQGAQHLRLPADSQNAKDRDADKPNCGDRAKHGTHPCSAEPLEREERQNDDEGDGHHPSFQGRRCDAETLDRTQHRNCRSDDPVSIEQRGPEQPGGNQEPTGSSQGAAGSNQCQQGKDSALPTVIGPHDHREVLERDHEVERPEDQGQDAQYVVGCHLKSMRPEKALFERVQGTGPDIPVDHPQRPEGENYEPLTAWRLLWVVGHYLSPKREDLRWSRRATTRMARMITAEPTHQRQMALMTNSSRYVRYA